MKALFASSSGYAPPISSTVVSTRSSKTGRVTPSLRAYVTRRRSSLRNTYPRPSFEGRTPSAIRNVTARPCSAMTRSATSDFGSDP